MRSTVSFLVSTRWRILPNCRVCRSAEFFATDHRLVVASVKLHGKSRKPPRCNRTVFHLEKLKDMTCAHEYAVTVSNSFAVFNTLRDPVELRDTFSCRSQGSGAFPSQGTRLDQSEWTMQDY